jgi:hypothetical protein
LSPGENEEDEEKGNQSHWDISAVGRLGGHDELIDEKKFSAT